MISNQQLFEKLTLLDASQKQTVYEFIDFLLSKRRSKKKRTNEFLLRTSVWSDEDLHLINEASKGINTWKPMTW